MVNDLNRFVCMGHVGADPKPLTSDNAPVRLSVATSDNWTVENTKNQRTDWHNIVVFGNLRKYAAKLKKGDRVYIEAQSRNNNYEKTVGGETITIYSTEFVALQIDRVATKAEAEE
jgi:single-strand DNA-binding protein